MKIIGFSKINGEVKMVLKGDSSLLVNRKPFFIPEWSEKVCMTPCIVLRVCKLGKSIGPRFAYRYYDAVAHGINMQASDFLGQNDWTRAWDFDYSMVVGTFTDTSIDLWQHIDNQLVISRDKAIQYASEVMTIRQGDMIYIDRDVSPRILQREEIIAEYIDNQEVLYCKIK